MAKSKFTGRRSTKAKPAAAALPNNSAQARLPNYHDLLNGLINVKGTMRLAGAVVYANMGDKPALQDVDAGLTLALREAERIYALMDEPAVRSLWETKPSRESESDDE